MCFFAVCIYHFKFGRKKNCSVYLSNTQSVNLSLQVWRFQSCCNLTFLLLVFVNSRIAHICHPCLKQHFTPLFLININFVAYEIISRRALTDDRCVAKSLSQFGKRQRINSYLVVIISAAILTEALNSQVPCAFFAIYYKRS